MSTPHPRPRHFSMLRDLQLADFFTLANAACGMGSVFYAMYFVADPSLKLLGKILRGPQWNCTRTRVLRMEALAL